MIDKIRKGVRNPAKADPAGAAPLLYMPKGDQKLKRDEIEAVADYLISLGGSSGGDEW